MIKNIIKCLLNKHNWDKLEGNPFDCDCIFVNRLEETCHVRQCKSCNYREYKVNGVWTDSYGFYRNLSVF
jgi:hypothetical protein